MEMISGPYGMDFNSRPHGGRPSPVIALIGSLISTHALTEGDMTPDIQLKPYQKISTHALTEGDGISPT